MKLSTAVSLGSKDCQCNKSSAFYRVSDIREAISRRQEGGLPSFFKTLQWKIVINGFPFYHILEKAFIGACFAFRLAQDLSLTVVGND